MTNIINVKVSEMVTVKCEVFACQDAKINTCGFSGVTKIVNCEIAHSMMLTFSVCTADTR